MRDFLGSHIDFSGASGYSLESSFLGLLAISDDLSSFIAVEGLEAVVVAGRFLTGCSRSEVYRSALMAIGGAVSGLQSLSCSPCLFSAYGLSIAGEGKPVADVGLRFSSCVVWFPSPFVRASVNLDGEFGVVEVIVGSVLVDLSLTSSFSPR